MNIKNYNFSECRKAVDICADCPCTIQLRTSLHVATAIDKYLTPAHSFTAPGRFSLNGKWFIPPIEIKFGEDFTSSIGARLREGAESQGENEEELKEQMRGLHAEAGKNDASGKSKALMDAFFSKKSIPEIWEDSRYDEALKQHENIKFFMDATLSAPGGVQRPEGAKGLHQELILADMDISKVAIIKDLGVPAVNIGNDISKALNMYDWGNGLAFMANGMQYVCVYVTDYCYSQIRRNYSITLEYHFYDVFGLDEDDEREFGGGFWDYEKGVRAWWQLQFQYGYAPLVTRGIVQKTFLVRL